VTNGLPDSDEQFVIHYLSFGLPIFWEENYHLDGCENVEIELDV
jgi:hypothetical protein